MAREPIVLTAAVRGYLEIVRTYPRILGFGVLHSFFAGLGQLFLLSIFVPHMRESFGLGRAEFGAVYAAATVGSAILMPAVGRLIDRFPLGPYSRGVGLLMLAACWVTVSAGGTPILLLGMLGLRLSGHGLMSHVEASSISRYFGHLRGKALGITSLGYPLSTAVLPVVAAWLITWFEWRTSFFLLSLSCVLVFLPLGAWLLRGHGEFQRPGSAGVAGPAEVLTSMNRAEVLRSPYFYYALPLNLMLPFLLSGVLFHQGSLTAYKGWGPAWVAYFMMGLGIWQIIATVCIGPLVDRFTARVLLPFHLLPMGAGFAVLAVSDSMVAGAVCFCLIGISDGLARNLKSALWAEVYGPRHVGAIRSLYFAIVVLASAVGPSFYGWLLDCGVRIEAILFFGVAMIAVSSLLCALAPDPGKERARRGPEPSPEG